MLDMQEALTILECGDWCSLRFITADIKQGTGGKVVELAKCRIARRRDSDPVPVSQKSAATNSSITRNPNHNENFTRNVELQSGRLFKVHPPLITHLNNRPLV